MSLPTIAQCEAEIVFLRKRLSAEQLAHAETRKKLEEMTLIVHDAYFDLNEAKAENAALREHIKKSQEQEPVGRNLTEAEMGIGFDRKWGTVIWIGETPKGNLYTSPVIPNYDSAQKPYAYAGEFDVNDIRDMRTVVYRDLSGFKTETKQPDIIYPLYRGEKL